jgi:hypothetical protein
VFEGFEALQVLRQEWPDERLASIAGELHDELAKGARAPMVEYIAHKGEEAADESLDAKMQDLVNATQESSSKFQQPCFQCLSDYQTAITGGSPKFLAGLALVVCIVSKLSIVKVTLGNSSS